MPKVRLAGRSKPQRGRVPILSFFPGSRRFFFFSESEQKSFPWNPEDPTCIISSVPSTFSRLSIDVLDRFFWSILRRLSGSLFPRFNDISSEMMCFSGPLWPYCHPHRRKIGSRKWKLHRKCIKRKQYGSPTASRFAIQLCERYFPGFRDYTFKGKGLRNGDRS